MAMLLGPVTRVSEMQVLCPAYRYLGDRAVTHEKPEL